MSSADVDAHAETLAGVTEDAGAAARTLADARRPAPSTGVIGKHFAHFRIEKELGRGGMGEVYLATDLALDRPVAVKILPRDVAADPQFRTRFIREARAQARIMHPNVCHIYFIGEQDDQLFFAMEHVDGENLQQRLRRTGKLSVGEAIELGRQAAEGLSEAQRHGFTHRDIKPSNLLLGRNHVLKLVDFGLVKQAASKDVAESERGEIIVGTPLYIAPEQARGDEVDFRADIYSLGVTLHELVAGRPPFDGATPLNLVSKHLTEPRPPLVANRRASLLDGLLDRMMAKRPEERFASYAELLDALAAVAPDRTRAAGMVPRALALGIDLTLVGCAAALVAVALGWLGLPRGAAFPVLAALYGVLVPARTGATYGKRALELELVADGRRGAIGLRRALRRFLVQWGPTYVMAYAVVLAGWLAPGSTVLEVFEGVVGTLAGLLPIAMGLLAVRSEGKRTLWDRSSGVRVVYERPG